MNPNGELKKYMQAIGELVEHIPGGHPAEETLIAYFQNRLNMIERKSIDLHLRSCIICPAKLEDAREFFEPVRAGEWEPSEFEVHKQWRTLREMLPFEQPVAARSQEPLKIFRFFSSRGMLAIAAGLLLTTSLMGVLAFRLWQDKQALQAFIDQNKDQMVAKVGQPQPEKALEKALSENKALSEKLNETQNILQELEQPQINTPVSEITVGDTVRSERDGRDELTTTLPPKANFFTIELNIISDSFPTYKIALIGVNGKTALNQSHLKPDERAQERSSTPKPNQPATLSVSIPRRALPPGKYVFRVYGQKGDDQVLLESLTWSFN